MNVICLPELKVGLVFLFLMMAVSPAKAADPASAGAQKERAVSALEQDLKKNFSQEELRILRMYLDIYRLPGACGHGVW